jgi:hypothetical protein
VFDKYQALAREAASSGDRIMAEAYWQYADHYFRMIQTQGGFVQRNNQGWGDGGEEGQAIPSSRDSGQPQQANGNGQAYGERRGGGREDQDGRRASWTRPIARTEVARTRATAARPRRCRLSFRMAARRGGDDPAADEQPDVPEHARAPERPAESAWNSRL